ncbi:unnamed protein product [Linum trigynum]|uniref:Retrotransposon Copia-like N-terminal domain-containing protein n=1 Tax=Linum trigynum TaxID=586398 RepID=A0AAV2CAC0_9ROSI
MADGTSSPTAEQKSESTDKSKAIMNSYEDPYLNLYHLPPQDGALHTIIAIKIVDGNYHTWSEVMLLALETKNKTQFINGRIPVSQVTDPHYQSWARCSGTIRCWI